MTNLTNQTEKPKFPSEDFEDSQFGYERSEDIYDLEREEEINNGVEDNEWEDYSC